MSDTPASAPSTAVPVTPVEAAPAPAAPAAAAPAARPEALPESFWDADAEQPKWTELQARLTLAEQLEAAQAAAREGVPETADGYKLAIDGDPILVDGKPVEFDPADPLAKGFVALAHEQKWPQSVVSKALRVYAEVQAAAQTAEKQALDAEVAKLGEGAQARFSAIDAFFGQHASEHARVVSEAVRLAPQLVPALEAVMAKAAQNPIGAVPPSPAKRDVTAVLYPNG